MVQSSTPALLEHLGYQLFERHLSAVAKAHFPGPHFARTDCDGLGVAAWERSADSPSRFEQAIEGRAQWLILAEKLLIHMSPTGCSLRIRS